MPKNVYGKRKPQSAFAVSTIFTDSSPRKSGSRSATRSTSRKEDVVSQAIDKLQELDIQDDSSDDLPVRRQRKPLSRRDGNSRPTSKHGEEDAKKPTKARPQKKEADVLLPMRSSKHDSSTLISQEPDMTHGSTLSSSSLYDLCDDYIRPLVAQTNEQRVPLSFDAWSDALTPHFSISKIAEASYSEVYRLSLLEDHPTLTAADESVLKVMRIRPVPIQAGIEDKRTPAQRRREEDMSSVEDVLSEVRLLKRMTTIPGFTNYRAVHILRGRPSKPFVQAWKEWQKGRRKGEKSEFPDPSRKANYDEEQYWAVIEMQDAGTDVEKLIEEEVKSKVEVDEDQSLRSVWSVWDLFWQTVLAVAKGESEARFEHRDLHLGNICVRWKEGDDSPALAADLLDRKLGFTNLETTIIDYTLSRADMSKVSRQPLSSHTSSSNLSTSSLSSDDERTEIEVAFNPLQRQSQIFEGIAQDEYQYEIYRYMRTAVEESSTSESDPWRAYQSKTNLIWLHFVLFKLLETMHWPSDEAVSKAKFKRQKKALHLEEVLTQVEDLLAVERLIGDEDRVLSSAAELVAVALDQGWLDQEDLDS